jgi:hypothetical protein
VLLRPVDFLAVLLPVALFAGGTVTTFPSLDGWPRPAVFRGPNSRRT